MLTIKARAGIDVLAHTFDHAKKRLIIETERVKVLVIRKEDSQARKERNLRDFLQVPALSLGYSNVTAEKSGTELWHAMKSGMKLSHTAAEIIYNSDFVHHFYSPAEVSFLKKKWMPSRDGLYFEPADALVYDR